jgi:hypothetical protein
MAETRETEMLRVRVSPDTVDLVKDQARRERVWPRDVVETAVREYVARQSKPKRPAKATA